MKKGREPVKVYKGFNKHMQCTLNGKIFQYEIGKEYKEDKADLCHCGFHACENPLDVLSYYNNIDDKFCEVELDKIDPNRNKDSKICGKKIKIGIEIGFLGLFKAGIEWIKNKTIFTKEDFKKLQRPIEGYTLENYIENMVSFNKQYNGKFIFEITIIKKYNDDASHHYRKIDFFLFLHIVTSLRSNSWINECNHNITDQICHHHTKCRNQKAQLCCRKIVV